VSMELQRHQLSIELQQWISDYLVGIGIPDGRFVVQGGVGVGMLKWQTSVPPLREGSRGGTDAFPLRGENRTGESVPHACRGNLKEGGLSINADSAPPADTNLQEGVSSLITAYCDYGVRFACAVGMGNLHAVQFHPEKSSDTGLQILRNFLALVGAAACSL